MIDCTNLLDGVSAEKSPPKPQSKSAAKTTTGPLYFDIETIPDFERQEKLGFGLPELPDDIPPTPDADMISAEEFVSLSLAEMREMLVTKNPSDEWIDAVREAERNGEKKTRKGVFDLLDDVLSRQTAVDDALASRCKTMSVTPEFCHLEQ